MNISSTAISIVIISISKAADALGPILRNHILYGFGDTT